MTKPQTTDGEQLPTMVPDTQEHDLEALAMNIVFQIGDLFSDFGDRATRDAVVGIRQATNDKAIDFVKTLIQKRDQQRLAAVLDIVEAEYQKLNTIGRVMDDGHTHLFIDCDYRPNLKKAITAVLAPDTTNGVEEKR